MATNKPKVILRKDLIIEIGMSISILTYENKDKPIRNAIVMNIRNIENNVSLDNIIIETISLFGGSREYTAKELSKIAYSNENEAKKHLKKEATA